MEPNVTDTTYESMLEARISELEALLLGTGSYKYGPPEITDIQAAITNLVDKTKTKIPPSTLADLQENDRLERELHPGPYLTHQATLDEKSATSEYNKPLMYQREEILASSKQFQNSLNQLGQIQELLSLSITSCNSGVENLESSRDYANAPIIASDRYAFCIDAQVQDRMDTVTQKVVELLQRADKIAYRVDSLVGRYHRIISLASEKVVLLDEELSSRERLLEMK